MEEYMWHAAKGDTSICSSKKKADALRFLICDSEYAPSNNQRSIAVSQNSLDDYNKLMNSSTGESGINNYADTILPMIADQRNESDNWKASLDFKAFADSSGLLSVESEPPLHSTKCFNIRKKKTRPENTEKSVAVTAGAEMKKLKLPQFYQTADSREPNKVSNFRGFGEEKIQKEDLKTLSSNHRNYGNITTHTGEDTSDTPDSFRTAKEQMIINHAIKNKQPIPVNAFGQSKKSLGPRRGGGKFVPPINCDNLAETGSSGVMNNITRKVCGAGSTTQTDSNADIELPDELSHLDPKIVELIMNEIMDTSASMTWDDIAGLQFAKKTIKEIIVLPMLRPDIFTGLRGPPKGLLLFGPPGTGKTLIGKCVASQSKCTFFSISASSLTSKWVGEGEKMVRTLFAVARYKQPAVVFIDEIDSLLTQRSESEHESSRRIKTEFLVQMDGVGCDNSDRILIIGATNRPQELDEAARRRFVKRLYIPLPELQARCAIINNMMRKQEVSLTGSDIDRITTSTDGYSGADMANLCKEAALGPVRDIAFEDIETVTLDQVRPIMYQDFIGALKQVRASVAQSDLSGYLDWNSKFGSWEIPKL